MHIKYGYFNIIKFVSSIIIALFFHYAVHFTASLEIECFLDTKNALARMCTMYGYLLVELYFLMSGMLFMYVYFPKIENGELVFDRFILKRILRCYPIVIITSVSFYCMELFLYWNTGRIWGATGTIRITDLIVDIVFSGKTVFGQASTLNGPIWYINVLLFCYIFAYILTKLSIKYKTNLIFGLPVFIGILIFLNDYNRPILNYGTARGMIGFFLGCYVEKLLGWINFMKSKKISLAVRGVVRLI